MEQTVRVSAKTKEATRQKVLQVSQELFQSKGFHETTSRDMASAVGIAAGTIFNYFPSKEAIVLQLVCDALEAAEATFTRRVRPESTLEEDLFLYVSTGLRQLKPMRGFVGPAFETHLGPACGGDANELGDHIRTSHVEMVSSLLSKHGHNEPPTAVHLQMYWLLYTGVLAFWAKDKSRKQEDTLALLDQSIKMFVSWYLAG